MYQWEKTKKWIPRYSDVGMLEIYLQCTIDMLGVVFKKTCVSFGYLLPGFFKYILIAY